MTEETKLSPEQVKRFLRVATVMEKSHTYDQEILMNHKCGTPGCFLGHAATVMLRRKKLAKEPTWHKVAEWLGIDLDDPEIWDELIDATGGCDFAGRDGKKAAEFIRTWAKEHAA